MFTKAKFKFNSTDNSTNGEIDESNNNTISNA